MSEDNKPPLNVVAKPPPEDGNPRANPNYSRNKLLELAKENPEQMVVLTVAGGVISFDLCVNGAPNALYFLHLIEKRIKMFADSGMKQIPPGAPGVPQ